MATKKNLTAAAQAVTEQFFTVKEDQQESTNKPVQAAQEGRQEGRTGKLSAKRKAAENGVKMAQERRVTNKGKKVDDTKVFSFRSWIDEVEEWRLYAAAKGIQIDELGAAAMREYIKRHALTDEEKELQTALTTIRSRKQKS